MGWGRGGQLLCRDEPPSLPAPGLPLGLWGTRRGGVDTVMSRQPAPVSLFINMGHSLALSTKVFPILQGLAGSPRSSQKPSHILPTGCQLHS